MSEALRNYLLSIVAVSLLTGLLQAVVPPGGVRRSMQFLSGLLLILVTIAPLVQLQMQDIILPSIEMPEAPLPENQDELMDALIKEQAEAYIESEARAMGYALEVEVETKYQGTYPYPYSVRLQGYISEADKEILSMLLEKNLAIAPQRLEWITDET